MSSTHIDQVHIFNNLTSVQRAYLGTMFIPCNEEAGMVIFEQGEVAEYLYVLVEGEAIVRFKPDDGPELVVAHVRPEGVVGWSAALGSPAYTSSAMCTSDCRFLRVRGADLRRLCDQYPEMAKLVLERLAAVIAERLRNTHDQVMALLEQGLRANTKT
jgi:CRP-like cAMP-binding protein